MFEEKEHLFSKTDKTKVKFFKGENMCTAITYKNDNFYFGRTLDIDVPYGERTIVMPRNFNLKFREINGGNKYAIMGTAIVINGYPLFFDAVNETGLCAAGLRFEGNAYYRKSKKEVCNVAQFEFIPWILGRCENIEKAKEVLSEVNITNEAFSATLPPAPLHWIIADKNGAVVVESVKDGINIFDNPVGVLTNNPPFAFQMQNLCNYASLSPKQPKNLFGKPLEMYSRGMGALGLPGDLSSQSRFVRASFARRFSKACKGERKSVCQVFHILDFVSQPLGCCEVEGGLEYTDYIVCYNADKGIYYLKTYFGTQVMAIDMRKEDLNGNQLMMFPHISKDVEYLN